MDTSVVYPPNGIVPFHGFTMYGKKVIIKLGMFYAQNCRKCLVFLSLGKKSLRFVTCMMTQKRCSSRFARSTPATGLDSMKYLPMRMELSDSHFCLRSCFIDMKLNCGSISGRSVFYRKKYILKYELYYKYKVRFIQVTTWK